MIQKRYWLLDISSANGNEYWGDEIFAKNNKVINKPNRIYPVPEEEIPYSRLIEVDPKTNKVIKYIN